MEFLEGKCPKCSGILQIPKNLENLICMYCGKELRIEDAIMVDLETMDLDSARKTAEDTLPRLLLDHMELMSSFKTNLYEDAFISCLEEARPVIDNINNIYIVSVLDQEKLIEDLSNHFVNEIKEYVDSDPNIKTKSNRVKALDEIKMVLALYILPMILKLDFNVSKNLAKNIHQSWMIEFPDYKIAIGNYEDIRDGFKKRKYCYITTAVCETLGKTDDCYELNLFREYRDNYLIKDQEGKELIDEYYRIAPEIVNRINCLDNKEEIYEEIWSKYLIRCIKFIEDDNVLACKETYIYMVRELQNQYNIEK